MLSMLLALALQDPAPAKTVEDRLKELEARLSTLEKRSKAVADENAQLEKRLEDAKAARENHVRLTASAWVKRYAAAAEFTEKQSAELEELWQGWVRKDQEGQPAYWDPAAAAKTAETTWKPREEAIRAKLSAEQAAKVAGKVREEQEQTARMSIGSFVRGAKISAERAPALEKSVLARLKFPDGAILLQARPAERVDWFKVLAAVEEGLPDLEGTLSAEELAALRATLGRWKPRQRP